jgi:hypothetical protein
MQKTGVPIQFMPAQEFDGFWRKDITRIEDAIRRIGRIEQH